MKHIFFLCSILLCFIQVNAQLKVDAGNDVKVCFPDNPLVARTQLGGFPVASGGIEPYIYTWSGKLPIYYDEDHIKWVKASEFLNDTTKSNPTFKSTDAPYDWVTFYLKVEDAAGNVEFDSVKIINAFIRIHLIYMIPRTIKRGDSIQFFGDVYYKDNKFLPMQYTLSPTYGLTDPTDLYGWAKPRTSTTYYLQVVNTAGCIAKNEYLRVIVDTTSVSNNKVVKESKQCYLSHGDLIINLPQKQGVTFQVIITAANGAVIHSGKYTNRNLRLSNLNLTENQLYVVSIIDGNERMTFKLIGI